jgi:hypothetical protein
LAWWKHGIKEDNKMQKKGKIKVIVVDEDWFCVCLGLQKFLFSIKFINWKLKNKLVLLSINWKEKNVKISYVVWIENRKNFKQNFWC